ncbi:tetratricopeptide repeat protein [Trichodesmium erythraeum 21-75]|nr:tetratricopeptide repeat protein [Trichodesmium erythraeum 21-75]
MKNLYLYYSYLTVMVMTISAIPSIVIIPHVLAQTPALETENSRESSASKAKGDKLFKTGVEQFRKGIFDEALENYEQVLNIRKELGDLGGIGQVLNNIGDVYINQRKYSEAMGVLQEALAIHRKINDRPSVAESLNLIGFVYQKQGELSQAISLHQEALEISQGASDRSMEGESLHNIAVVKASQRQFDQALQFYLEALAIREEVGDPRNLGRTLNNIGVVYFNQGNYDKALEKYQKALSARREINDSAGIGRLLNNIGFVYREKGENSEALKYFRQAVAMLKTVGDQISVGRIYGFMGMLYQKEGEETKALEAYEKSLEATKIAGDGVGQLKALNYLGDTYYEMGENTKAKSTYEAALVLYQEAEDSPGQGKSMIGLGKVYNRLGENQKAKEILLKSLSINQTAGEKSVVADNMNGLGEVYYSSGDYSISLNYYMLALKNLPDKNDKNAVSIAYHGIGDSFLKLKQYPQALENLEKALARYQEVGNTAKVGRIYEHLGTILVAQEKPELAVVFYKQAINIYRTIGSQEYQKGFWENSKEIYSNLVGLLLQQERIFEAQQVLDLLRLQELDNYFGNVKGNEVRAKKIKLLSVEEKILAQKSKSVLELEIDQNDLKANFSQFQSLQFKLEKLPGAALFYPLILPDKLELVLITADGKTVHETVEVKGKEVERAIADFRRTISNPIVNVKKSSEKLYNWLIKPIENELTKAKINTIIYVPDKQLRYLPLAALYDGEQWLVERFIINNIIAASLTSFETQPQNQLRVLAAALTEGEYKVRLGSREVSLRPTTGKLVENLVEIIPGSRQFINSEFSSQAIVNNIKDYNVLHLDTPVALLTKKEGSGKPEDSFILFGDGDRITLSNMENWSLPNVDLVVLSAAETNISGRMGNGEEIIGFGYQMQNAGVETIIASLWRVNDDSDNLMNTFYTVLQEGKSKAEALRKAQISMITGNDQEDSNPYYWASFILIGNGL